MTRADDLGLFAGTVRMARFELATLCWRTVNALMPFVEATLLGRRSLPRLVLGRLGVRLVCWLMLTGKHLAPELAPEVVGQRLIDELDGGER